MWIDLLQGRRNLLQEQHIRPLLQTSRGPDLLQHRHDHPKTFRGPHHVAAFRDGLLFPEDALFQIQAEQPDAKRIPAGHRITRNAHGKLFAGHLG